MLKDVTIGGKFSYLENDYRICCMGKEGNFESAEKTLNYFLGIVDDEEQIIIEFDEKDKNSVFKKFGKKVIYFYEDSEIYSEERLAFVKSMNSKFPASMIHIVITSGITCSLHDVYERCKDIIELNEKLGGDAYLHNVVSTACDDICIKLVVGA